MSDHPSQHQRPERAIRSYVLRKGRLTKGQQRALEELLPRFAVPEAPRVADWPALFGREAPVALEIGIGGGEALVGMAGRHPNWNWVGLDVYPPGVGKLLLSLEAEGLDNVRVGLVDAVDFLADQVPDGSLAACYIFFPDPWSKERHKKRRLIQAPFLDLLAERLAPGADLFLATDWADYAQWMVEVMEAHPRYANIHGPGAFAPRCPDRPPTKFEERGEQRGHEVYDLHYRRL
ncbi:tRNA (guanosine(46)-N7)-methyltransferase TrmB [Thiohalorhabdus methylotrophus]|uniref:tRNA (guanine-N(7)-)-methyltransferase n=1 Tax=Thiohalorhabdus methylotrophus TaxID=3242694 RepID=A0ABV4TVC7_9GAMM